MRMNIVQQMKHGPEPFVSLDYLGLTIFTPMHHCTHLAVSPITQLCGEPVTIVSWTAWGPMDTHWFLESVIQTRSQGRLYLTRQQEPICIER